MRYPKWQKWAPLLALLTAACQATPTTVTPVSSGAPPSVLCSLDPPISYAAPKPGQVETAANSYDTAQTVGAPNIIGTIRYHNAVRAAACGP